jgi:hypothetical protein
MPKVAFVPWHQDVPRGRLDFPSRPEVTQHRFQGGNVRNLFIFTPLLLGIWAPPVGAEVYRCVGEHGEPAFSRQPCGSATRVVELPVTPEAAGGTGIRDSERRWLEQREKARQSARSKSTRRKPAATDTAGRAQKQRYQCRRKARALDAVKARLRRGYRPGEREKLRRRRADYEDYLDAFCG